MATEDGIDLVGSFLVVAEELNFLRAAERLNLDRSALTRRIQRLEHALNFRLFERTTREVVLTQAGQSFYKENAKIFSHYAASIATSRRIAEGKDGHLRLAYMAFAATELMPAGIAAFCRAHPHIEVSVRYMRTQRQKLALANNEIDLGYMIGPFNHPDYRTMVMREDPLYVVAPPGHPLLRQPMITPMDLAEESIILGDMDEWGAYRRHLDDQFHTEGIDLKVRIEASNTLALIGLVAAGMGITIYPKSLINFIGERVEARPIAHPNFGSQTILAWRRQNHSTQLKLFLEIAGRLCVAQPPKEAEDAALRLA